MATTAAAPCDKCGYLGAHSCPGRGTWSGPDIIGGYLDARASTRIRQWAWQIDCEATGCDGPHSDRDRLRPLSQDDFEPGGIADSGTMNGHKVRILTRIVVLPAWEDAPPPQ